MPSCRKGGNNYLVFIRDEHEFYMVITLTNCEAKELNRLRKHLVAWAKINEERGSK